jgi:hypothetical protein
VKPHAIIADRHARAPGQIVSADIIDARATNAHGGFKFASVIVDHYTYWTSVALLPDKSASSVLDHIKSFHLAIKHQTGNGIRIFRSDRGLEYNNSLLNEFALNNEIALELAVAREPRDNGFAERRGRTLIEATRALLATANLPQRYWPYAMEYACHLQNRTGRRAFHYKSPHEILLNQKPVLSNLVKFGLKCWVHTATNATPKFALKAEEGIVVGCATNSNGYRVLLNDKIIISRNVTFSTEFSSQLANTATNDASSVPEGVLHVDVPVIVDVQDQSEQLSVPDLGPTSTNATIEAETPRPSVPDPEPDSPRPTTEVEPPNIDVRSSRVAADAKIRSLFRESGRALTASPLSELPPEDVEIPKGQIGFAKANKGVLKPYWERARQLEIDNQIRMGVFELCWPKEGANIIRGHFIHSAKTDSHGKLKKLKARLVADGCGQLQGIDYEDTYAATPSPEIIRMMLTIAANRNFEVHQVDVDSAYLHAPLDTEVFMRVPQGVELKYEKGQVLRLKRALYGLKQAGRQWAIHLNSILATQGWTQNPHEPCLFMKKTNQFVLVYVDDILVIAPTLDEVAKIKKNLESMFPIKDLGEVSEYLGIEIKRDRAQKTFRLRQKGAIQCVIDRANRRFRTHLTPKAANKPRPEEDSPASVVDHEWYRSVVGQLQHITRNSRPDICFATNVLARSVHAPSNHDIDEAHHLIGYLEGTKTMSLELRASDMSHIKSYSDSDWAGDTTDRKSTSGFICYLGNSPVHWTSKKQKCTSASTFESEYIALSDAARETLLMKRRAESVMEIDVPAEVLCDNQAAEIVAKGGSGYVSRGAKHIDLKYHIVRDLVESKELQVNRVDTNDNVADVFTKPLVKVPFTYHRANIPVLN